MADASEGFAEAHEVNIPPYSDDEAQEIAVYRKMMKDDAKAAKRQRREQAVSDKEKRMIIRRSFIGLLLSRERESLEKIEASGSGSR